MTNRLADAEEAVGLLTGGAGKVLLAPGAGGGRPEPSCRHPCETGAAMDEKVTQVAELVRQRNAIDEQLATLIGRLPIMGHLGEWVAIRIFDLESAATATQRGWDARFRGGPHAGRTVNVKFYGKGQGILDLHETFPPDFYLVLVGPRGTATSSRGASRPTVIEWVHLFDARKVHEDLQGRGRKIGIASSVRRQLWDASEIYPADNPDVLPLSAEQREAVVSFAARRPR